MNAPEGAFCFNIALSDKEGFSGFFRNKVSHTNSLHKVNLSSKDSIGISASREDDDFNYSESFNSEIKVPTTTLDSFTKLHGINLIDLLKIDVQGAEALVLAGGSRILQGTRAVVVEIIFYDYYEEQSSFLEIERILHPLGFRLFSISELSHNPMNGRTDWAEVIYVNKGLAN